MLKDNAYTQITDIDSESAVYIVAYENNHRIVAEKSLYFQGAVSYTHQDVYKRQTRQTLRWRGKRQKKKLH